jgi:8-oxo-dGTP pyrophosphatase MutT (NUDIX family)
MRSPLMRLAYRLATVYWWFTRPMIVGVRVLLIQDGQVMLVRHTYQDHWYLPGGAVKKGEMPIDAARHEVMEEVGADVGDNLRLAGVFSTFFEHKSDHVILFVCEQFEQGARPDSWEIEACRLIDMDTLPTDLSLASSRRIDEYRSGARVTTGVW